MAEFRKDIKGRGASSNIANRFEKTRVKLEPYEGEEYSEEATDKPKLRTELIPDASRSIISENDSPDIPFRYSVNPYRGCEHGCAYCYARPTHEYLGFSAGLDFESKILVKHQAPELLREKFMSRAWKGESITFSGNTDCYQPVERRLRITRRCLEVCLEFKNPVSLITKNALITRDIEVLAPLAQIGAAVVFISVTSLDDQLCADLEPRTSRPQARLRAIEELSKAGIPVGVNVAPMIPGLNDHEMADILKAAREAGASYAGFVPLRLPLAVAPLFDEWLKGHRPERRAKVLSLIKDIRGGSLNDSQFGSRMRGQGAVADSLRQMFRIWSQKLGLNSTRLTLDSSHFARPGDQLALDLGLE